MSRRFWTEDKIISEIQKLHENGEDLWYRAMERNHKALIRASERYFKGWQNAVEAAGLDYNGIKKRTHQVWTEDKILERLMELQSQKIQLKASKVQQEDKKLYLAIIRQYRSFDNVLAKLEQKFGIKTTKSVKSSKAVKGVKAVKPPKATKAEPTSAIKKKIIDMKVFTVRTRIRSERIVGESIEKRAKSQDVNIGNIQYPAILNGYIFVECESREKLKRLIKNIRNAQGLLNGETTFDEISKYVKSPKSKKKLYEGSHVEITDGQFKGEHAVIQHVNDRTDELTLELVDEILKIPIIMPRNRVKRWN
jgi:transcription elongation factor Spt5